MYTLEDKIGQMLMVGFHGLEPPDWLLTMLREGQVGGVILFARNIESPQQVAKLTRTCHDTAKHPILIAIDQEGGIVTRLHEHLGFTESPGAMALAAHGSEDLAEEVAGVLGKELRTLGINWNLAPVVDLTHSVENTSIGTRSLGDDKKQVSRLAAAQIRGFQNESVAATPKHFPGIGNTPIDTHEARAVIDDTLEHLWEGDLVPFRVAIKSRAAAVMLSHVTFTQLDADNPATLSPAVINDLLRDEIGFEGVTCTDCMEMRAIADHYSAEESAVQAVIAGEDIVLFSHSFNDDSELYPKIYDAMLNAAKSGKISTERIDQSNTRISRMKARFAITQSPTPVGIRDENSIDIMERAARLGVVQLRDNANLLPLPAAGEKKIALIEFASYLDSGVMESGGDTNFGTIIKQSRPDITTYALKSANIKTEHSDHAKALVANADLTILATRSTHLYPEALALSKEIVDASKQLILLCLRNPYDIHDLTAAQTVLCTCGDSLPSLRAAVQALIGSFIPSGKLPVEH